MSADLPLRFASFRLFGEFRWEVILCAFTSLDIPLDLAYGSLRVGLRMLSVASLPSGQADTDTVLRIILCSFVFATLSF
jgi:hypothetical protein